MNPKLTIGLPVYNAAGSVKYAILSVLNQTFAEFELIITDDGSTDDTLSVIQSIDDNRIRIVHHDENRGIACRLNEQIMDARGLYFARMDADDLMMSERLQKQVDALDSHPEIDVLGTAIVVMDDNHDILGQRGLVMKDPRIVDVEYLLHPTVMGKTEWFRKNLYNESYSGWEDYELWLRTRSFSHFKALSESLLFYRDSRTFNVRQFIKRRMTGCKVVLNEWRLFNNPLTAFGVLCSNFFSCIIVPIVHVLHLDELRTRRRNNPLAEADRRKYECLLKNFLQEENN